MTDIGYADSHWMRMALDQADLAAQEGEVPVGAVVVKDGQLIATGRNGPVGAHDPSAHAEILAMRAAAAALGNYRLDGCQLFVTLEPCAMCSGAMLHARLKRVVFGAADPRTGAAGSVINLFEYPQLNHQTQVQGGVLAADAAALLQAFFKPRRINTQPVREDALRTPEACFADLPGYPWPGLFTDALPALGGLRMHYLDVAPDKGVPASGHTYLCLHGSLDWSYAFREPIPGWTGAGHRVIAPDLIGFGKSDKPKKESFHTLDFHQRVLLEFVEFLGIDALTLVMPDEGAIRELTRLIETQHGNFALQRLQMPAGRREPARAYDAPFPERGHRAGQRAFVRINNLKLIE